MIVREVTIPLRLVSLTNQREHWAKKANRAKVQRNATKLSLFADAGVRPFTGALDSLIGRRWLVTLTRVAPRQLDGDNMQAACKSVRDGVADFLCLDDGDRRIVWQYAQERGNPKEYAVRIRIELTEKEAANG